MVWCIYFIFTLHLSFVELDVFLVTKIRHGLQRLLATHYGCLRVVLWVFNFEAEVWVLQRAISLTDLVFYHLSFQLGCFFSFSGHNLWIDNFSISTTNTAFDIHQLYCLKTLSI